jgi:hypothetical protein
MCQANADTATEDVPIPCELGQDQLIPCTLCAATHAMCRDPALNPSL